MGNSLRVIGTKFNKGDKVIAVRKTSGHRDFYNCSSFYRRVSLGQDFLYVNGIDGKSTKKYKETCYWCDAIKGMGDSYRESDLIPYAESAGDQNE